MVTTSTNSIELDYRSAINTCWVVVSMAITFLMVKFIDDLYFIIQKNNYRFRELASFIEERLHIVKTSCLCYFQVFLQL
jgi:hypothetical protein